MKKIFQNKSILIIEDDVNLLDLYGNLFEKNGACVKKTISGQDGVDLANKITPDLVITGILLPYKNGIDVIKEIKNNPKTKNIPILVVSGISNTNIIKKALDFGAVKYLDKSKIKLNDILHDAGKIISPSLRKRGRYIN